MWVPVQEKDTAGVRQLQMTANCETHKLKRYVDKDKLKLQITQQKQEETKSTQKRSTSEKTTSWAISTIIWYSMFTVTIRNIIVPIQITCNCANGTIIMY